MSFNGLQGYYLKLLEEVKGKKLSGGETGKINYFCQYMGLIDTNNITSKRYREAKTKIVYAVMKILNNDIKSAKEISKESLQTGKYEETAKSINQLIKDKTGLNIPAYKYLIADFAYWIRNNIFHAEKPILLFSSPQDKKLNYIRIVNELLEEFLDGELYKWFREEYIKKVRAEAAKIEIKGNVVKRKPKRLNPSRYD